MEIIFEDWDKLQFLMTEEAQRIIKPGVDENWDDVGKAMRNTLFDTGSPTIIEKKAKRNELYFGKIFKGFLEIDSSIRTLKDIEIYIASFPYHNKTITKPRHLRYHLENYFNEIYLLKERLIAYLTTVGKSFKKDDRHQIILSKTKPIFNIVRESLKSIVDTRGSHVHVVRFNDNDLDRLEMMELLVASGSADISNALVNYYKFTYTKIRRKWKNTITNNNKALRQLLNIYAKALIEVIFDDKTGKLFYPKNIINT